MIGKIRAYKNNGTICPAMAPGNYNRTLRSPGRVYI
jgi:hypothetical protein